MFRCCTENKVAHVVKDAAGDVVKIVREPNTSFLSTLCCGLFASPEESNEKEMTDQASPQANEMKHR